MQRIDLLIERALVETHHVCPEIKTEHILRQEYGSQDDIHNFVGKSGWYTC